jgi:hypothetical protein
MTFYFTREFNKKQRGITLPLNFIVIGRYIRPQFELILQAGIVLVKPKTYNFFCIVISPLRTSVI